MRTLNLESAISDILDACNSHSSYPPFFFIVGAGISCPSIPLAASLEEECKGIAHNKGKREEPPTKEPIDRYSHWLGSAFPHSNQRRDYLQQMMKGKSLSPASLRLAHLLQDGRVSRLVVTPNFDDFVGRALALFGEHAIVCDHPATIMRLNDHSHEIQILHVHGNYWFYDCCNLKEEISQRANNNNGTEAATISSFLSSLLWNRSPLVIGYSGWENDVIMTALKARLMGQVLPFNIYWFCHTRENMLSLPSWLKEHDNVCFVVPSANKDAPGESMALEGDVSSKLDAAMVFTRFVQRLELGSPLLFTRPFEFFKEQLERDIYPYDDEAKDDIYQLRNLLAEIASGIAKIEQEKHHETSVAGLVRQAMDTLRSAKFTEAITICRTIKQEGLTEPQRDNVIGVLLKATGKSSDASASLRLEACELALRMSGSTRYKQGDSSDRRAMVVHASYNKGELLREMGKYENAIGAFDACIEAGTGFHDIAQKCPTVAEALFCKGLALGALASNSPERRPEEIETYRELRRRYLGSQDSHLRQLLARGLTNLAMALEREKRDREALITFREVLSEFGRDKSPSVYEPIAKCLVHIGLNLNDQDPDGALEAYNEVIQRFGQNPIESVRDPLARALANKGRQLERMDRWSDALAAYDDMLSQSTDMEDGSLDEVIVGILQRKGRLLGRHGQHTEAVNAFGQIIQRFRSSDSPDVRAEIPWALHNMAVALHRLERDDEALKYCDEVLNLGADYPDQKVISAAHKLKTMVLETSSRSGVQDENGESATDQ